MEKLLHAVIYSGPRGAALALAGEEARRILCEGREPRPCGVCRQCRKTLAGVHPDLAYIRRLTDAGGKPRKNLLVEQIRALGADASVLPNEAAAKVYILPEADAMNREAQNAFLKLLEEPPDFAFFLLCAENAGLLLPTVRSRCALRRAAAGETPAADDETEKLARALLEAWDDPRALLRRCVAMEKLESARLLEVVECARAMAARGPVRDAAALTALEGFLGQACVYLRSNVGVKHVTGFLSTYTADIK